MDQVEPDSPEPERLRALGIDDAVDSVPQQIGPYRILDVLGEGGMGIVYVGEQREPFRRRAAVKVIKLGMDTKDALARFEAERQALAIVDHPNIAKVYDAGATSSGRLYFAMELIRGEPITDYCERHRVDTSGRLALFVKVCKAVQHAHEQSIVHRDLKPANVLVTIQDGEPIPKIIDFGIAKATNQRLTERTLFTEEGRIIGTPEYMSPEQAEMTGLDVDTRTDVYSLGVMLYELLSGELPFDPTELRKAGYLEIQRCIREKDPLKPSTRVSTQSGTERRRRRDVDLTTLAQQLRGDLDWITMKALEKDRTRRYQSPLDFAEDVTRHLNHQAVEAGPPSLVYRTRKFLRRHRATVAVGALVLCSVVAGIAARPWFDPGPAPRPHGRATILVDGVRIGDGDGLSIHNPMNIPITVRVVRSRDRASVVADIEVGPGETVQRELPAEVRGEELVASVPEHSKGKVEIDGICIIDCFPAGTPVLTPCGQRAIETLSAGDLVLDGAGRVTTVQSLRRGHTLDLVELDLGTGALIRATVGHRFLTRDRGWVRAGELRSGDILACGADGARASRGLRICAIGRSMGTRRVPVYSLVLPATAAFGMRVGWCGVLAESATARQPAPVILTIERTQTPRPDSP